MPFANNLAKSTADVVSRDCEGDFIGKALLKAVQ